MEKRFAFCQFNSHIKKFIGKPKRNNGEKRKRDYRQETHAATSAFAGSTTKNRILKRCRGFDPFLDEHFN